MTPAADTIFYVAAGQSRPCAVNFTLAAAFVSPFPGAVHGIVDIHILEGAIERNGTRPMNSQDPNGYEYGSDYLKGLPDGATFEYLEHGAVSARQFCWTPQFGQECTYRFCFTSTDRESREVMGDRTYFDDIPSIPLQCEIRRRCFTIVVTDASAKFVSETTSLAVPDLPEVLKSSTGYSISLWFYTATNTSDGGILFKFEGNDGSDYILSRLHKMSTNTGSLNALVATTKQSLYEIRLSVMRNNVVTSAITLGPVECANRWNHLLLSVPPTVSIYSFE